MGGVASQPILGSRKYFMVLWGIADEFGGMTTMSLHRAGAFNQFGGRAASVLTFEPKASYNLTRKRLEEQGKIAPGTKILNVFQHYREADMSKEEGTEIGVVPEDYGQSEVQPPSFDPEGRIFYRNALRPDGKTVAARSYYRRNGSEYLRDESPQGADGKVVGRFMTLFNESGNPVAQWRTAGDFYRHWLRELSDGDPTALIVDSAFASNVVAPLDTDNIIKLMVLHNSHVAGGGDPYHGKIATGQKPILDNVSAWDGIVFLTRKQRKDFEDRFGTANNLFTVSNPKPRVPANPSFASRSKTHGVMVCRLEAQKNVSQALEVMSLVHRRAPHIVLDIYGTGSQREELEQQADALGLGDAVIFHGHTANAAEKFETARFSLLTSRNEGQPLALMESLGRGCPPVSYDIRYGPSDVITDGDNGFLVTARDTSAAAEKVLLLCSDDALAERMGKTAWERSEQFSDEAVIRQWATTLDQAWIQRLGRLRVSALDFELIELGYRADGGLELSGALRWRQHGGPDAGQILQARLAIGRRSQGKPVFFDASVVERAPGMMKLRVELEPQDLARDVAEANKELDIFLQVVGANLLHTVRIGFPGSTPAWRPYATAHGSLSLKFA